MAKIGASDVIEPCLRGEVKFMNGSGIGCSRLFPWGRNRRTPLFDGKCSNYSSTYELNSNKNTIGCGKVYYIQDLCTRDRGRVSAVVVMVAVMAMVSTVPST